MSSCLRYEASIRLKHPNIIGPFLQLAQNNFCKATLINESILTFSLSWAQWHYRFCWEPSLSDLWLASGASVLMVTPEKSKFDAKATASKIAIPNIMIHPDGERSHRSPLSISHIGPTVRHEFYECVDHYTLAQWALHKFWRVLFFPCLVFIYD